MDREIDFYMGTATFHVNMESSADKATYKGKFKVRCVLSPIEFIRSDSMYRELLGNSNPQFATDYVSSLCYALSQLKYRIIESPAWYKNPDGIDGGNLDDSILLKVLDEAVNCESDYREGIEKKYEKAKGEVVAAIEDGSLNDGVEEEKTDEETEE